MSDWDDDDFKVPVLPGAVKANWDDEDAESEQEPEPKAAPRAATEGAANAAEKKTKKSALEEKIREREEREAAKRRALTAEKSAGGEQDLEGLDPIERKLRLQKMVEESDLQNTKELFMDGSASEEGANDDDTATLDSLKLRNAKDDELLAKLLAEKIKPVFHPKRSERYVELLKGVLRACTEELDVDDVKELATTVNVISNDKLKKKQAAQGKKKKNTSKRSVRVEQDDFDSAQPARGVLGADYDDFM
mmetsp:Transcript_8822/g.23153  ORF Transcript_8822/g.23153 Transcript_8822/m.23153 type:complete len:249 (-) Transcript_8822:706-1452(-)|eukprot:CAMPEP_0185831828 /NCGR_PEP_ID=MMETSP1353-20130828/1725_1 /TAXON_ID=1077150 /ORGANISM="Erythrolobus australicus, Strain CCMP3124" /LENGTH=248 /DNA_ID=CAMNT_0028529937 /DNA_START=80 /DNA_END=826 /DNA_ORIENTATION=+